MQVGERPPIAPKPRSIVLPVPQQYQPPHRQQRSHRGADQRQAGVDAPPTTPQECLPPSVTPRLKRANIPPPPVSPPPPLPAPRIASLRGGARLPTSQEADSCHYDCSEPGGIFTDEPIATSHYECMVVDDLPEPYHRAGRDRSGSRSSGYGNSSGNGSNDSIYGNVEGGGNDGSDYSSCNNAGSPPRQPDLRKAVHPDGYVAFIPPDNGTLKRRLCRTKTGAQKPAISKFKPAQKELQGATDCQYETQSGQAASAQTEYYSNSEVVKDGPSTASIHSVVQPSTASMHSVVQPSIMDSQRRFSETKAKVASMLADTVAAERPSASPSLPLPPPPPAHESQQPPQTFPIVSLPSEPRPRSMSTSTWRRGQAPSHSPQSCSMSMRIRSAVVPPHSNAPQHPFRHHFTAHTEEAASPYDNADDDVADEVHGFPAPPPPITHGYATAGSNHNLHAGRNTCNSPVAHSSSGGDSDYERISPRGSFIEQLMASGHGKRRDSVYSSVSESSMVSSSSSSACAPGDFSQQQQQAQQQQVQFFNAWEQYLRGANPCGGGNDNDGSSSESDVDETENVDYSSDEGAVMDVATTTAVPSARPVPMVRRSFSRATPLVQPCPVSSPNDDDAACRLTRNNAIRRGPRSSGRGEVLRAALLMPPPDLAPSLPSLLSESSKESLSDEVTTTERLCDDCRFWKKMEFRELDMNAAVCAACQAHRRKRTRVVAELVATEEKYGHNLNIVKEVFMSPMLNGLVPAEYCQKIFLNLEELIDLNSTLCRALKRQVDDVSKKADWEEAGHRTVVGKAFAEHLPRMKAFEVYCVNQASSARALNHYSKKSSLFKVFLQVCQNDDDRCASMPLPAFLIAPLQRVTRYPLLLAKVLSHTPPRHPDYAPLSDCLKQLEVLLDKINSESAIPGQGNKSSVQSKPSAAKELLSNKSVDELLLFALGKLGWSPDEADLLYHGPLEIQAQQRSSRKGTSSTAARSAAKTTVTCAVLVQLKRPSPFQIENPQFAGRFKLGAGSANTKPHLVLVGVNKNGDMICEKDPLALEKCVVAKPALDFEGGSSCFDVSQMTDHSSLILKAPGPHSRDQWLECLSQATRTAGLWRQRRRGLPNIMIFENCKC